MTAHDPTIAWTPANHYADGMICGSCSTFDGKEEMKE